jgi:DNA-binding NarL/FixJ family response regulator
MAKFNECAVTPRDQQVLDLLVQGCSNKEIGGELKISPSTVKQHLHKLFCHARILDGRKRVKLIRYLYAGESAVMTPCAGLNPTEGRISILVWEGWTNREIGRIVGTSEQMIKNHLSRPFDKPGVDWNWQFYVTNHGVKDRFPKTQCRNSLGSLDRSKSTAA